MSARRCAKTRRRAKAEHCKHPAAAATTITTFMGDAMKAPHNALLTARAMCNG